MSCKLMKLDQSIFINYFVQFDWLSKKFLEGKNHLRYKCRSVACSAAKMSSYAILFILP